MTHTHATRFVVAFVLLATVVAAGSVIPTASHVSDSESIEGNHMGTADAWGIDLAVEEGEPDLLVAEHSIDTLEITATVTNNHRYSEDVDVSFEVGTESETEAVTLEGGESESVTFVLDADELDEGDHEYVVTAAEEEVHGQATVPNADEEAEESEEDENESSDDEAEMSEDGETDGGDSGEENDDADDDDEYPDSENAGGSEDDEADDDGSDGDET